MAFLRWMDGWMNKWIDGWEDGALLAFNREEFVCPGICSTMEFRAWPVAGGKWAIGWEVDSSSAACLEIPHTEIEKSSFSWNWLWWECCRYVSGWQCPSRNADLCISSFRKLSGFDWFIDWLFDDFIRSILNIVSHVSRFIDSFISHTAKGSTSLKIGTCSSKRGWLEYCIPFKTTMLVYATHSERARSPQYGRSWSQGDGMNVSVLLLYWRA